MERTTEKKIENTTAEHRHAKTQHKHVCLHLKKIRPFQERWRTWTHPMNVRNDCFTVCVVFCVFPSLSRHENHRLLNSVQEQKGKPVKSQENVRTLGSLTGTRPTYSSAAYTQTTAVRISAKNIRPWIPCLKKTKGKPRKAKNNLQTLGSLAVTRPAH